MSLPTTLRSRDKELSYQRDKLEGRTKKLKDEPSLKEWQYWRLIDNRYHCDVAFQLGHMLIPKRVVKSHRELGTDEWSELYDIFDELEAEGFYDELGLNFVHRQSLPDHLHLHLRKFHDNRYEMHL